MKPVRRHASGFLVVALSAVAFLPAATTRGATRDSAYYPVSARSPSTHPAPPVLFERACEATLPGLPVEDPPRPDPAGETIRVVTTRGVFSVRVSDCGVDSIAAATVDPPPDTEPRKGTDAAPVESAPSRPGGEPAHAAATGLSTGYLPRQGPETRAGAGPAASQEAPPPRWAGRLKPESLRGFLVMGPGGLVAVFARDGSVYGRLRRSGHMLWRHVERHRVSRPGASLGDYLLVAADATRTLDALRWSDGSAAGLFRLDSEDAAFVSAPIVSRGRVLILATQSPREETRLLAVVPKTPGVATEPPTK